MAVIMLALAVVSSVSAHASAPFPRGNLTYAFAVINMTDGRFSPDYLCVYKNATVTWVNLGPSDHALRIGDNISPMLFPGDTYTINFHETGMYNYSCRFHDCEHGIVIVK